MLEELIFIRLCFLHFFVLDTRSLWDNIVYQPATQTLTWESACPVHVTVSLCQLMKINDQCVDLEGTVNIATEKVSNNNKKRKCSLHYTT